jgi:DNA-nicking Smr family endonuclease
MSDDKDESSIGSGGLADQLAGLDIDAPDREEVDEPASDASDDAPSSPERTERRPAEQTVDQADLSDEELFERAISEMSPDDVRRAKNPKQQPAGLTDEDTLSERDTEQAEGASTRASADEDASGSKALNEQELFEQAVSNIGPEDIYRGKFEGRGAELPDEPEDVPKKRPGVPGQQPQPQAGPSNEPEVDEQQAREALGELRTMRQFEKAVGPVDRDIDRDKYRDRASRRNPKKDVEQRLAYRSDSPDEMTTPPLPKSGEGLNNVGSLDPAHKDLLERFQKRARRNDVFEINVRGDSVEDALRQVELFVHQQWKEGSGFCRIVHGRGLRSDGAPVLKPAILRWLEGPGFRYVRGYAPETNNAGDYGSVVVELAKRRTDST